MNELLLTRLFDALIKALDDPQKSDNVLNDKSFFIRELSPIITQWYDENKLTIIEDLPY